MFYFSFRSHYLCKYKTKTDRRSKKRHNRAENRLDLLFCSIIIVSILAYVSFVSDYQLKQTFLYTFATQFKVEKKPRFVGRKMYLFSDVLNDCATKRRSNRIFAWTCTILVINLSLLASSANAASIGESLRDLFSSSTTKPTPSALTEKHNRLQDEFKETLMNTTFLPFISECNNAFVKREKDAELNITLLCPSYFDLIEDLRENKILDYNKPDAILATLRDYDNASLVNNFCTFFGGELPTEVKRRPFVHEFLIDEENLLTKQHICRDVCFIHIESEKKTDEKIQPICKLISGGYRLLTKKTQLGEVTVSPSEIQSKKDEKEKKQEPKEDKTDVKQIKTIEPKANATEDKSKISTTKAEKKGEDKTTNEQPKTSEIKVADKTADVKAEAKDEETNKNDDEIKDDKNIQTDDKPGQSTIDEKAQNPPIDEQSLLDEIERK